MKKIESSLKKNFIWNTLGSGINCFTSLIFLIIVTRINGVDKAGVFSLCFATSCMLIVISNYAGRTFQVTDNNRNIGDKDYIFNRFICSLIMIICSFLFGLFRGYSGSKFDLLILLCLFKVSESIAEVFYGVLQKNERLDLVGKSLFFKSSLDILLFFIVDYFTHNLILACISMIIVNFVFILFYDVRYLKKYIDTKKLNIQIALSIFKLGFFTFAFSLLSMVLNNIPKYAIEDYLLDADQTIYSIIIMPATFVSLLNWFIFQPIITRLKEAYNQKDYKEVNTINFKILEVLFLILIACEIGAYIIGIPFLEWVYGLELNSYLYGLLLIILGACFYNVCSILSINLLILRKSAIQVVIYLVTCLATYFLSMTLVSNYFIFGGFYAYLLMMFILMVLYTIVYIYVYKKLRSNK